MAHAEVTWEGRKDSEGGGLSVQKAVALLLCVGLLVYANSLTKVFLLDDQEWIDGNANINNLGLYLQSMASRAVVALSLALNYWIGGYYVGGYHLVNLAIHLAAALTLFGIIRRTLLLPRWAGRWEECSTGLALAAALLWLVHPLQTQAVTYIIQRCESLMGLFFLLTLYCVLRGAGSPVPRRWYAAAVLCSALGMASKEVMIAAPLVVLAYDWVFLTDSFRNMVRRRWALYLGLAVTGGILLARMIGNTAGSSAGFGYRGMTPLVYLLTQPGVILHYVRLSVWPDFLCFDYLDWPKVFTVREALVPGLVLTVLFLGTLWSLWRRSWLGFLGVWFFLILAPTSSIMPIADVAFEHRMYLPLAALAVLAVMGGAGVLDWLARHEVLSVRRQRILAAGLIALSTFLLGARTVLRNEDYRSGVVMWSDVVAQRPNNSRGHTNLAYYLVNENRSEEAIGQLRRSLELNNRKEVSHVNLGYALWKKDQTQEAFEHVHAALGFYHDSSLASNVLGTMLLARGDRTGAVRALRKAVDIDPRVAEYRYDLALALAEQGKTGEAREQYDMGKELEPYRPWSLHRRAWQVLLQDPAPGKNQVKEAIIRAEEACQATDYQVALMVDTLAAARAAAGQFPEAVALARKARDQAAASGQSELRRQIEIRLRLYQRGRPFRREFLPLVTGLSD